MALNSIELFAGAGGLALGASLAGFIPKAVIEWNSRACDTIRGNQILGHPLVRDWPLYEGDVRDHDFSVYENIDLVAGGAPCQPFSLGGRHKGREDKRDMFPAAINVVSKLRPRAFLFENVKGLTREAFAPYLRYVELQLSRPELTIRKGELWHEHLRRIEREKLSGKNYGLAYIVDFGLLNAADYGVPQRRERLFIVGFRSDIGANWSFPSPHYSLDGLLYSQWISGEYWDKHGLNQAKRPEIDRRIKARVEKLRGVHPRYLQNPWRTVRDAISDLPEPYESGGSEERFFNHAFQPGAKLYAGHTGSPLDLPAKTIKAADHGVPGGENMLSDTRGRVRYFTTRESARLQCFPDDYVFRGSWSECMRQLGNAVQVRLAHIVTSAIAEKLTH